MTDPTSEPFAGRESWLNGWIDVLRTHNGDEAGAAATAVLSGAIDLGLAVKKQSQEDRGFSIAIVVPNLAYWPECTPSVAHDKGGRIDWEVAPLTNHRPFSSAPMADQLWARIESIPGLDTSKRSYPDVRFVDLGSDGVREFLDALAWVTERIRRYNS